MSANCDIIIIFPIYGHFGVIWKPDFRCIVCKTHIFIYSNVYLTKTEKRTKNLKHSFDTIALSKVTIFAKKILFLEKQMLALAKLRESWY